METPEFDQDILTRWSERLIVISSGSLPDLPRDETPDRRERFVEEYRDEFGARNASVCMLLRRVLSLEAPDAITDEDPDVRIWRLLISQGSERTVVLTDISNGVVAPDAYAIEHRTLIELSSLHALAHACLESRGVAWDALFDLVDWHTRELQPDNGIHRPWGIHAFIARSAMTSGNDTGESQMHAQTLLHNCCVQLGKPDQISAVLLSDASNWLTRLTNAIR